MGVVGARSGIWGRVSAGIDDHPLEEGPDTGLWDRLGDLVDPGQFRPKFAGDIEVKEFKLKWGNDYVMIANPRNFSHYRLGTDELELIRLMDGTRTVKEIVLERFRESGDLELSVVADLVRLLHEENFLEQGYQDVEGAVTRALSPVSGVRAGARKFAKTQMVEWEGADRVCRWLYRHGFKWFFTREAVIASTLIVVGGLGAFFANVESGRFSLTGESLAFAFLILIFLDYFSVFLHELGHALVLTRNDRKLKSAGFMIYFGSPAFFVEASESLMLDRGKSILQSFAGPFAQLQVGGVCSLVALAVPGWAFSEILYRTAVLNYWMVFVNLMPMLELDGYYILSDAIQVPDLRPRSLAFIRHDLLHKLRVRERFAKHEVGLALYGILGVAFTVLALFSSFFYWRTVFGGLVSRLWNGGTVTRVLLVTLGVFVASPLVRGALNLLRALGRRLRALARRIRFRLERKWRVEAAELIDALPLFDDVPEDVLSDLAGRVRLRSFSDGQPVVRQGERATAFYVVRTGTLQVVEEDRESGSERTLRTLGRGEAFGELGLKEAALRTCTVRSAGEAELFEIDKSSFDRLLADMIKIPHFAPTLQEVAELRELPCFAHLEADELSEVLERGAWVNISPGEAIVQQGEVGEAFFAIRSGQVDVFEDGEYTRTMGPGAFFGEIALLLDVPRTATVIAKTPVRAYRLDREGFDRLIAQSFGRGTLNPHPAIDRVSQH